MPAAALALQLGVGRATMMRAIRTLGAEIITRGKARRTAYAIRRPLRGSTASIPLFRIDRDGLGTQVGALDPLYPQGCAVQFDAAFEWPTPDAMRDGWFEGMPYPLDDMRPQGFLGRHFARRYASLLQVPPNPLDWSEDDTLHALSLLGTDLPGNFIIGEPAYRLFLDEAGAKLQFLSDADTEQAYVAAAQNALEHGVAGSSAGGEFPKFIERRLIAGEPVHVIVKFSGADDAPGTQRWADLLVCEHLALEAVSRHLQIDAARSQVCRAGGRTFLEVQRFDRHGVLGRSPVCSWAAINNALFGLAGRAWTGAADALLAQGHIDRQTADNIRRLWHFGQLIANSDMHDGNLAFRPGLTLAPVYDMLPMQYAPVRGVELPRRRFAPALPLPSELSCWREAAAAAIAFWQTAAQDERVGKQFRQTCAENSDSVERLLANPVVGSGAGP